METLTAIEKEKVLAAIRYIELEYDQQIDRTQADYEKLNRYDEYYETALSDLQDRSNFYSELHKKLERIL